MSQAEELLAGLDETGASTYTVNPDAEPHIIVNPDRTITIPEELKHIAVQFDHNIETVTFDCPRFWDEHDFSTMKIYVVYRRPDGYKDRYAVKNLRVDDTDKNLIHFEWTISKNVTLVKGNISFIVCINKADEEGIETNHWNSRLNQELAVDEGLECSTSDILEQYPDILEAILARLDAVDGGVVSSAWITDIELLASKWIGDKLPYSQVVNIPGINEFCQVSLNPSVEQLVVFYEKDLTFVTENEDGVVTVYAIGQKPANDYTIQVTIKEVRNK